MTDMTVSKYMEIKAALKVAQEAELEARLALVKRSGHTKPGSKTIAMDGFKLAIQNTVNISLFEPSLAEVKEKLNNDLLFDQVFKPKREYSVTGAKALTAEQREIVEDALIMKEGTPQLTVKSAVDS
ncbi:hypothetical protein D3C81_606060 [compost metagenome]